MDNQVPKIFISYSHRDEKWKDELKIFLNPKIRDASLVVWDDRDIEIGERWNDEIKNAILSSDIAIVLVTKHFLNSDFIQDIEIPFIQKNNLKIYPLIISPCDWKSFDYIQIHQGGLKDNKILAGREEHEVDEALTNFVERLCRVKIDKVIDDILESLPKLTRNEEVSKIDQIFTFFEQDNEIFHAYKVSIYIQFEDEYDNELLNFTFEDIHDIEEQKAFIELLNESFIAVPLHFIVPPELFLMNFKQWKSDNECLVECYYILLHNQENFTRNIKNIKTMCKQWNKLYPTIEQQDITEALLVTDGSKGFDVRKNKIGIYFETAIDSYEIVKKALNIPKVGLWQYKDGTIETYNSWIHSEIKLNELEKKSRDCDYMALLWDDMNQLIEFKKGN